MEKEKELNACKNRWFHRLTRIKKTGKGEQLKVFISNYSKRII